MKNILLISLLFVTSILSSNSNEAYKKLTIQKALELVQKDNLEIDIAEFDKQVAQLGEKVARGYSFGKLDATLMGIRSNDAGNVFGFKLQSREADFGDFGFDQFLAPLGGAIMKANANELTMQDLQEMSSILNVQPDKLNYPDDRNHFDTKLSFIIPLYTGNKLSSYRSIAKKMVKMGMLDKKKVEADKKFEVQKTFYNISLLSKFEIDLATIKKNIEHLRYATIVMRDEGYAKKTDLLEVESKLSDVERMLFQASANKELSYHFLSFLLNHEVLSIKIIDLDTPKCKIPLDMVLSSNRDIQKANLGLSIQEKMVDVASSTYKPEVGAFAEYGSSDDKFLNDFKDHDRYTVGVQAKINIFNGGVDSAKIEQEKIKRIKVSKQVELAKKGIALQYRKIRTQIKNLNKQIDSIKREVELQDEIYQAYQERYQEGLASINDVVIKQSQQIEKLLKLLQFQNSRNEKMLEIQKLAY